MNQYPYIATYQPPFPAIDIALHNSDTQLHTVKLKALLDTGADGTLIPLTYLREILAPPITESRLRSHWGEWRIVQLFLVEIQIGITRFPNVFVIGDEQDNEIVLGRNILNRLNISLNGPALLTTLR